MNQINQSSGGSRRVVATSAFVVLAFVVLAFAAPACEGTLDGSQGMDAGAADDGGPATDAAGPPPQSHTYAKTEGPNKNPLKGWNASWSSDKPEASVGFQYVPWKTFEPQDDVFDTAAVEKIIDREGTRNRHLVLRLYCQWGGDEKTFDATACPPWLNTAKGVKLLVNQNGKTLIDFNDPAFVQEATEAVAAFAQHYDSDPRIFTIQMGLLGYWGEWHTFYYPGYTFSDALMSGIVDAYSKSFKNKRIVARYPWREPFESLDWIGYHNDYFLANNGHSDEFDKSVSMGNKWRQGPIGGEVPPESGNDGGKALYVNGAGKGMIETGHYSTMSPGGYHRKEGEANYDDYMYLHRRMGYNFQIDEALFVVEAATNAMLPIVVKGTNVGVAPFYYDWDIELALIDAAGALVAKSASSRKLSEIGPGDGFQFDATVSLKNVAPAGYRVGIRLIQPGAAANKSQAWKLDARNVYVQFANKLTALEASWNQQHALEGGWSILGDVVVTP